MSVLQSKDGIRYELLSEDNLFRAVKCVSRVFTQNEPMSRHLGITYEEFLVFAQAYYTELIDDGLSLVALDEATESVIGVRISEDYCHQKDDLYIEGLSEKFGPLFGLLGELSAAFENKDQIKPGQYVHMFMVAVDTDFTRRGIAPTMYRIFIDMVLARGYTHAITEPTGVISQHILLNKFGFKELSHIDYDTYLYDGEYVFRGIKGHSCAMLLEKDLQELRHHFASH